MASYWKNKRGNYFEFEASTNSAVYAWFRNLRTEESVRLLIADLTPVSDEDMLVLAKSEEA